jgi:hypothetical protein
VPGIKEVLGRLEQCRPIRLRSALSPEPGIDVEVDPRRAPQSAGCIGHLVDRPLGIDTHIDVISQHHGTSLVSYFYQRALQQQEDARLGGKIMNMREEDIPEVSEESFRYPGPRPQTKEAAIVSLADSIESASRSLDRPTPQRIDDLIRNIIKARLDEGQLDESPLTIAEIWKIADSFRFSLVNMLHARIAYPKREERSAPEKREQKSAA